MPSHPAITKPVLTIMKGGWFGFVIACGAVSIAKADLVVTNRPVMYAPCLRRSANGRLNAIRMRREWLSRARWCYRARQRVRSATYCGRVVDLIATAGAASIGRPGLCGRAPATTRVAGRWHRLTDTKSDLQTTRRVCLSVQAGNPADWLIEADLKELIETTFGTPTLAVPPSRRTPPAN